MGAHGWEYRQRRPEGTVLYAAVRDNLATLLAEASELGRGLPRYVARDFARYLECGVLAHGFARVRCESCKDELLVAFSCKGRGVCPSCNAKRAHVTAVHLVERVLPHVPYRQWTLSFAHRVRWVLLEDVGLLSAVLTVFLRAGARPAAPKGTAAGLAWWAGAQCMRERSNSPSAGPLMPDLATGKIVTTSGPHTSHVLALQQDNACD